MNAIALRLPKLSYTSGTLEVLKWVALAAMLIDHANTVLFGREVDAMYALGRLAFPVFAVVIGYNMARARADHGRLLRRLLWVGLLAQPLAVVTINRGELLPLNVLFTFAAAIVFVRYWSEGRTVAWLAVLLGAMALVDYMAVGVLLVAATYAYARKPSVPALAALAGSVLALCLINGNGWALVAVAGLYGATRLDLSMPRLRWAFWVAYPAHLMVLGILARL